MGIIVADELLVYFIQVIGLQYHAADYPLARGGFEPDFDFAEEDVEFGLNGGCVASFINGEGGAGGVVGQGTGGGVPEGGMEGGRRVEGKGGIGCAECWVRRTASAVQRVAGGPGLRCSWKKQEG